MARIQGFEPLAEGHAHTLILGSMPSRESLLQSQYYAHPRNSFWRILAELLRLPEEDYARRARRVSGLGYAIWDVLQSCRRRSSLDSDIVASSIQVNDFAAFYLRHNRIKRVFFNGAKAENVYRRHVLENLPAACQGLRYQRLPSTSPAHAGMSFEQKRRAWRALVAAAGNLPGPGAASASGR
jgi:TDG/mug DNA glycosylase family protein